MVHSDNLSIACGLVAIALGPWVSTLWSTGGTTQAGSSPFLRRFVKLLFWVCVITALVLAASEP